MKDYVEKLINGGEEQAFGDELPHKLQIAVAALLVYGAKADGVLSEDELSLIMHTLAREFHHEDYYNAELIEVGLYLHQKGERIEKLAKILADRFTEGQKTHLVATIARIIKVDGCIEKSEKIMLGQLAKSLGLVK